MILIDTDHATYLKYPESDRGCRLVARLAAVDSSEVPHQFEHLREQRLYVGTMDLKIAATALVHEALLLSANRSDFERVPGLHVENWLD
jgi:predicted nucleic acid-binding protein